MSITDYPFLRDWLGNISISVRFLRLTGRRGAPVTQVYCSPSDISYCLAAVAVSDLRHSSLVRPLPTLHNAIGGAS